MVALTEKNRTCRIFDVTKCLQQIEIPDLLNIRTMVKGCKNYKDIDHRDPMYYTCYSIPKKSCPM